MQGGGVKGKKGFGDMVEESAAAAAAAGGVTGEGRGRTSCLA